MEKKEILSKGLKARTTKLSKKSNEELISIILKKDNTEKQLNGNVRRLKAEVNKLQELINSGDKELKDNKNTVSVLKDRVEALVEKVNNEKIKYDDLVKTSSEHISKANNDIKAYKNLSYTSLIFNMLCVAIALAMLFS